MKPKISKLTRTVPLILMMASAVAPRGFAQAGPVLDIRLYAGITITGAVGTAYSVEYVTDLAQTNNPAAWRCLEFLRLPASPYAWTDMSEPINGSGSRFYRAVAMVPPTNMVFIPPGTFRMGSSTNEVDRQPNEGPETQVVMSRGFWIQKYEVTQREYLAVMGSNPSFFQPPNGAADLNRPVEMLSWEDATNYCATLTERERAAARIPPNCLYRLPTEAEWEYACRAWTSTRFSYGDDLGYAKLTDYAWYGALGGEQTHPVGQKLPNPWGLHDMHGNVVEWCQDCLDLPGGTAVDPVGATGPTMMRGGHWNGTELMCRSAFRMWIPDGIKLKFIGFRAVLTTERQ